MKSLKISTTILLVSAIVILVNVLSENYNLRLDFTENHQYTLSKATRNILANLQEPVTVTAYFSKDLPPNVESVSKEFRDMLIEYGDRSKGMVVYKFENPNGDPKLEQEAVQAGVQPVMINVREKDQMKQQKAYLGAVVSMGDSKEIIPFLQPGSAMEYALSSAIKKLSVTDKPAVALIQGHGEPSIANLIQAYTELSVLYNVKPFTMTDTTSIPDQFKTIMIVKPQDSIPPVQLKQLDDFLARGGNIFLAMDRVTGNFSTVMGSVHNTGLETWLKGKGVTIAPEFVVDSKCGSVSVQQSEGNFPFPVQISFPYLPVIQNFAKHPITSGLEAVMMRFASPVSFSGDSSITFTPIAFTSDKSGELPTPLYFNINKQWQESDFPMSRIPVAAALSGKLSGNTPSKMVVISDGDFAVGGDSKSNSSVNEDNVNLLVNSIDWLSDDTGLISLRTKSITSRPIKELKDSTKTFLKWFNFMAPILLVVIYGLFRMQMNRNKRFKRMEVSYE